MGRKIEEVRGRQADQLPLEQLKAARVPTPVVELLKSMLAVDPSKRPQSARELLAAVHRCYLRFEPPTRSRRKRFAITAALSAAVIAANALCMLGYTSAPSSTANES